MRNIKYFYFAVIWFSFYSCNPNCENITGLYFAEHPYVEEGEILIKASNVNTLRNRNVFFNEVLAEKTTFVDDLGLIAKMPQGVTGDNVTLRIQDQDCADFVSFSLNVKSEGFFVGNPDFVPPAPPQIIIAVPNPPLPPSINNAWISPNNTDYCIWFVVLDVPGSPGNFIISPITGANGKQSEELSVDQLVCGSPPRQETEYYHKNPVYGMINTNDNLIQFWIDRSSKGLGIEEFEGKFIDINDTPYNDDRTPGCKPWNETKLHMMMVTSKQTNLSLLLYQQLP
jgi:hypothetical protein